MTGFVDSPEYRPGLLAGKLRFKDQALSVIVGQKIDGPAVRSPVGVTSAPVLCRGEIAPVVTARRSNPEMGILRDTVDGGHVSSGGQVRDPFSVRRPRRLEFAAGGLRNLPNLSLQVYGENI